MERVENESQSVTQQASNRLGIEDDDMFEEVEIRELEKDSQEEDEAPTAKKPRKSSGTRSSVWADYIQVMDGEGDEKIKKGKCKRCGKLIRADPNRNGTTALKNHTTSCLKRHQATTSQSVLNLQPNTDGTGSLTSWKFDQNVVRMALCEMIIMDELPFRFVEREGFKKFMEAACPMFKIPGRQTVRADCMRLFLERKVILKSFFQAKGMGRVSITTDCWTGINNTNFICVTAHCIDKEWKLHKKIISFRKCTSHTGEDLATAIISSVEEWGLHKVLCCTMDNATANDAAIRYMKPDFERWGTSVVGGKYLHMRCVAHVLNLIVKDGLDEIGLSVRRVREAVKWMKASPSRVDRFRGYVVALKIDCSKSLTLDVPTRWNSTYLMLESAVPYKEVFVLHVNVNKEFVHDLNQKKYKDMTIGVPDSYDWAKVKMICDYLGRFHDLTLLVSGTTYVSAHLFFKEMCSIFEFITQLQRDDDAEIRAMANEMKEKLGKYWLETDQMNPRMNKLFYIAALLDPRQKITHVEKCLRKVYAPQRAIELLGEVRNSLNELFEYYKKQLTSTEEALANTPTSVQIEPRVSGARSHVDVISDDSEDEDSGDMSEITVYFAEKKYKHKATEGDQFDILQWWSKNSPRFPILSEMVRDIMAIPISSVASEAAFSTGGRVLSQFRSSLTANMVEALICAEDWLKSSSSDKFLQDEEDVSETELEKEFESVLTQLGMSGGHGVRGGTSGDAPSQTSRSVLP